MPLRVLKCGPLFPFSLTVRLNSLQDRIQEITFRQGTFERLFRVDHCLGYSVDAILGNEVGEFSGLDAVGRDVFALQCKLMGQAHRLGAMGSRGSDKNLEVYRLAQSGKLLLALGTQS